MDLHTVLLFSCSYLCILCRNTTWLAKHPFQMKLQVFCNNITRVRENLYCFSCMDLIQIAVISLNRQSFRFSTLTIHFLTLCRDHLLIVFIRTVGELLDAYCFSPLNCHWIKPVLYQSYSFFFFFCFGNTYTS